MPYTQYPNSFIKFYFKGKDPKYNILNIEQFENCYNICIIARFPPNYNDSKDNKRFTFVLDDDSKVFYIYIKKEGNYKDMSKFFNFPYKTLINGEYTFINNSNKNELMKKEYPFIFYSPFSHKYFNLIPDFIMEVL